MRLYIAHELEDSSFATDVESALKGAGHKVFRRAGTLEAGKSIADQTRRTLARCDFLIFIASPASVAAGKVSLSDLVMAHEKWRDPKGRIVVLHSNENTPIAEDTRLSAFAKAGPVDAAKDVLVLVAEHYANRRGQQSLLRPAAAILALALGLGGPAYHFRQSPAITSPTDLAAVQKTLEPTAVEPTGDIAFDVEVNYSDTVHFGEKRHFQLKQTSGKTFPYKCKAGPSPSSNIKNVTHDEYCTDIVVTAIDAPFTDDSGKPYALGYSHPERDIVPIVVESKSGKEVFRRSIQFRVSNGGTGFLLQGMDAVFDPMSLSPKFVATPGNRYEFEILTPAGMPLPSGFECGVNTQYRQPAYRLTFSDGCKGRLENAKPGNIKVQLRHSASGYMIDLFFDLVEKHWQATPPSEFVGVSDQQWLDSHLRNKKSIETSIQWREADRAIGRAFAKNDWYLNHLKQSLDMVERQIERDKAKLGK